MTEGCPDDAVLRAVVLAEREGDDVAAVAAHVETCERCQQRAARFAEERARLVRGGHERKLVPEEAKRSSGTRPWLVASVAAGILVGAFLATRLSREPAVIDLTTGSVDAGTTSRPTPPRPTPPPSVSLFASSDDGPLALSDGSTIKRGAAIAFVLDRVGALSLTLVELRGEGEVRAVARRTPETGGTLRGFLSERPRIEATTRFFALFAPRVFGDDELRAAARAAFAASGRTLAATTKLELPATHALTWLIEAR